MRGGLRLFFSSEKHVFVEHPTAQCQCMFVSWVYSVLKACITNGSLFLRHFMGSNFFGKVERGNSILGLNGKASYPDIVVQPPGDVHILLVLTKRVPLRRCNAFFRTFT